MRFVLDTNVLVAGLRSPRGASAALLRLVLLGKIKPLVSVPLFLEYESVLLRPKHLLASQLTDTDVINFLNVFAGFITPTEIFYLWRPQLKDVNDDMVLETAVNGMADILVTFNTADFLPAVNQFNIKLMLPNHFLQELKNGH